MLNEWITPDSFQTHIKMEPFLVSLSGSSQKQWKFWFYRERERENQVMVLGEFGHGSTLAARNDERRNGEKLLSLPNLNALDTEPPQSRDVLIERTLQS